MIVYTFYYVDYIDVTIKVKKGAIFYEGTTKFAGNDSKRF